MKFTMIDAILSLVPQASFSCYGSNYTGLNWTDDRDKPTEAQIKTEQDRLESEYTANEYSRNRREAYPDWGTQLEKIADDGIDKWKSEMLAPVKVQFPKPD